ncbi:MAG TPA: hypothetical protein VGB77_02740, partial [Abditibacteriaceae bacterium]
LEGYPVAWASPTHKMLKESWLETRRTLAPLTVAANASDHRIDLITGGVVEMWSLENFESIRGRKYKRWVIDEAAMVAHLGEAWRAVIRPTLTDYKGDAYLFSTPRGMNFFWECFQRGQDELQPDWNSWQMPTVSNPFIDPSEVEAARLELPERVYRQEYLAEFIEDAGGVFRGIDRVILCGVTENEAPQPGKSYSAGADLARLQDFTVIDVVDENGKQVYHERFNSISWERQMEAIQRVSKLYNDAPVVLDCTGVGDPIFEGLRARDVPVIPFKFSSSSKEQLINNMAMRIEQNEAQLMDIAVQTGELRAYEYQMSKSGNLKMNAPEGQHDDCVCALALAYWGLKNRTKWEWD